MGEYDPAEPLACFSDDILLMILELVLAGDEFFVTTKTFKAPAMKAKLHPDVDFSFISKSQIGLGGGCAQGQRLRRIYLDLLQKHIVNSAGAINVKVEDLKFDNLKKLLSTLKANDKLAEFELDDHGEPQSRGIVIRHHTTSLLQAQLKPVINFDKYSKALSSGKQLNMGHLAALIDDLAPVHAFLRTALILDSTEGELDSCATALHSKSLKMFTSVLDQREEEEAIATQIAERSRLHYLGQ